MEDRKDKGEVELTSEILKRIREDRKTFLEDADFDADDLTIVLGSTLPRIRELHSRGVMQSPITEAFINKYIIELLRTSDKIGSREKAPQILEVAKLLGLDQMSGPIGAYIKAVQRTQQYIGRKQHDSIPALPLDQIPPEYRPTPASDEFFFPEGTNAIWRNKDSDQPVTILTRLGRGSDGREYVSIDGTGMGIPLDELILKPGYELPPSEPEAPPELTPEQKWEELKKEISETWYGLPISLIESGVDMLRGLIPINSIKYSKDRLPENFKERLQYFLDKIFDLVSKDPIRFGESISKFSSENYLYIDNILRDQFYEKYDNEGFFNGRVAPKKYKDFIEIINGRSSELLNFNVAQMSEEEYSRLSSQYSANSLEQKIRSLAQIHPYHQSPEFLNGKYGDMEGIGKIAGGHTAEVYLARWTRKYQDSSLTEGQLIAVKWTKKGENVILREEWEKLIKLEQYQRENGLLVNGEPISPHTPFRIMPADDNRYYMVTTLAEGIPVNELLKNKDKVLPYEDTAEAMRQFLALLESVHVGLDRSMTDLHPNEIYWDKDKKKLTVIDFNVLGGDPINLEQKVDKSVYFDIYRAAHLFYRLLTNNEYDDNDNPVYQLEDIKDSRLRLVLAQALHPDSSKRFKTAKEFRLALDEATGYGK